MGSRWPGGSGGPVTVLVDSACSVSFKFWTQDPFEMPEYASR